MGVIQQIICEETGEVWQSQTECAVALGVSSTTVNSHIRFHDPLKGKHYRKGDLLWKNQFTGEMRVLKS